jgi:hypothetical protein
MREKEFYGDQIRWDVMGRGFMMTSKFKDIIDIDMKYAIRLR